MNQNFSKSYQPKPLNNAEPTMNNRVKSLLCAAVACLVAGTAQAQFQTITAGAVSTNPGSKLKFVNGTNFDVGSGYAVPLIYTSLTNFLITNSFYSSTNLQFWSLSLTNPTGSAAVGSYIVCELLSVTGPAGGVLTFWEQNERKPTYTFPVGVPPVSGSNRFDVSDISATAGLPDGDPVGRIPTRRFTVNKAGDYFITAKLLDLSTNSAAWGPKHTESDPITIKLTTGTDLALLRYRLTNDVGTFILKQSGITNLFVEVNTDLTTTNWVAVAGPFTNAPAGTNATTLSVTNPAALARFYRLRGVIP
jgi:hypothetical protein